MLGHDTLVAEAAWPAVERELLVEDTLTLPVQINGKKRAEVVVAREASNAEIEAAVVGLDAVKKALDGKSPKKVIIVTGRIVNVVAWPSAMAGAGLAGPPRGVAGRGRT